MKIGLTLSGGGANGAFHVGALEALNHRGINHFDAVSGVSIGAFIGANANNLGILKRLWGEITGKPSKVFTPYYTDYNGKFKFWKILKHLKDIINGRIYALADNTKLKEVINTFVRANNVPPVFIIGVTSLSTGEYHSIKPEHCINFSEFKKALLASTSMIPFWKPVDKISLKDGNIFQGADGGLRTVSPLADLKAHINQTPDKWRVFVVNCRKFETDYFPSGQSIFRNAIRADEIKQAEIFRNDSLNNCLPDFETVIIQPSEDDYIPSPTDFSEESMVYMRGLGYRKTLEAIEKWEQ